MKEINNIESDNTNTAQEPTAREIMRQKRIERRRKYKRRKTLKKIIAISFAVAIAAGFTFALYEYYSSEIYRNSDEYEEFANKVLSKYEISSLHENCKTENEYSKEKSVTVRKDSGPSENLAEFRDFRIDSIINNFNEEEGAVIIDSAFYETGNGAYSMYIQSIEFTKGDKKMDYSTSNVETYLYDAKTEKVIDPVQVLNINYKNIAAEYSTEYVKKKYTEEQRNEGWEGFLTPTDTNYNKFVMNKDNIIFLFNENTVAVKDTGVVTVPISQNLMGQSIRPKILDRYIYADRPMVAVTYDDGPGGKAEEKILACLERNNCVATFFYLGSRVGSNEDIARRAVEYGCEIGNHSWDHPQLTTLSKKQLRKQMDKTNKAIFDACGIHPTVARPPYGDFDKTVVKESKMAEFLWTVDTLDWKTRNPKKIFKSVKRQKNLDGKIILMHSIYDETAKATEMIIPWLKKQGYQTVTVSELVKYKTGETPKAGSVYRKLN